MNLNAERNSNSSSKLALRYESWSAYRLIKNYWRMIIGGIRNDYYIAYDLCWRTRLVSQIVNNAASCRQWHYVTDYLCRRISWRVERVLITETSSSLISCPVATATILLLLSIFIARYRISCIIGYTAEYVIIDTSAESRTRKDFGFCRPIYVSHNCQYFVFISRQPLSYTTRQIFQWALPRK